MAYRDERGVEHERALREVGELPFQTFLPVRKPSSYRDQPHLSGGYWFSTTGTLVPAESGLRRVALMLLDFDPSVVAVSAQPFVLIPDAQRRGCRARILPQVPDFFARLACGSGRVVDVIGKPEDARRPGKQTAFDVMREACREVGWEYIVMTKPEQLFLRNLRWLAGFRRIPGDPRSAEYAEAMIDACACEPRLFRELTEVTSQPVMARPILFHLLWRRVLTVALKHPLTDRTPVTLGGDPFRKEAL